MHAYLECACVGAVFGHTLFVHGAVDRLSAGYVPPRGRPACTDSTTRARPTENMYF